MALEHDHIRVNLCKCGLNYYCPNCGEGQGAIPCRCSSFEVRLEESIIKYKAIWKELK